MRSISQRMRARAAEAKPFRDALLLRHPSCMICGNSPEKPRRDWLPEYARLCVHEIANGQYRQAALDKPYACLVLCWGCNCYEVTGKGTWPQARQLAVLKRCLPGNYDLAAFNKLINPNAPNRITEEEVADWLARDTPTGTKS